MGVGVGLGAGEGAGVGAGAGFAPAENRGNGMGLNQMAVRVQKVGGRFAIQSRPGQGTTVEAWLPSGEPRHG